MKSLKGYFKLGLGLIFFISQTCLATTLQELYYRRLQYEYAKSNAIDQNREAREHADRMQARRLDAIRQRVQEKINLKRQKLAQKNELLAQAKSRLIESGQARTRALQNEHAWVEEQHQIFKRETLHYQSKVESLGLELADWITRYEQYQATQLENQSKLESIALLSPLSTQIPELVKIHEQLLKLKAKEAGDYSQLVTELSDLTSQVRSTYRSYQITLTPLAAFLEKYQLPTIEPPLPLLESLKRARAYLQQRNLFFSEQGPAALLTLEAHIQDAERLQVSSLMNQEEEKQLNTLLSHAFNTSVHQLLEKRSAILHEVRSPYGCGQKLRPLLDFYTELLPLKTLCYDRERLKRENSPYFLGCQLITSSLLEADSFISTTAFDYLMLTASLAQIEPIEEIQEAGSYLETEIIQKRSLKMMIKFHDQLLDQWTASSRD